MRVCLFYIGVCEIVSLEAGTLSFEHENEFEHVILHEIHLTVDLYIRNSGLFEGRFEFCIAALLILLLKR